MSFIDLNTIFLENSFVSKAYVEGIYNDSPLNRKLGRVGMSYKEYAKLVADQKQKEVDTKKKELHTIPENVGDLKFDKDRNASYDVNKSHVELHIVREEKYKDKIYRLTVTEKGKEEKVSFDGTASEISRKMKALKEGQSLIEQGNFRDILPLSPEELDEKWGDTGFVYTYIKDDLDIKVWKRADSDSKNPTFNIYVKNVKTKKQRNYTKLSLLDAHNKLLEFDLNPNFDKPLTAEQLKEKKRIMMEEKYGKDYKSAPDYISPIIKENNLIKYNKYNKNEAYLQSKYINVNGNRIYIGIGPYGHQFNDNEDIFHPNLDRNIELTITRWDEKTNSNPERGREKKIFVKNLGDLSRVLDEIEEKGQNYDLHDSKNDINPTKDIGIDFNRYGSAWFKKGNYTVGITVNPEDRSKLDIFLYKLGRSGEGEDSYNTYEIVGLDSCNVENFKNKMEELDLSDYIDSNNQVDFVSGFEKNLNVPTKDLVEDYSDGKSLAHIGNALHYPEYSLEEAKKDPAVKAAIAKKKFSAKYDRFNKPKIDAIAFVKSKFFKDWLDQMPESHKYSKQEIINKVNDKIDRITYKNNEDMDGSDGVRWYVMSELY